MLDAAQNSFAEILKELEKRDPFYFQSFSLVFLLMISLIGSLYLTSLFEDVAAKNYKEFYIRNPMHNGIEFKDADAKQLASALSFEVGAIQAESMTYALWVLSSVLGYMAIIYCQLMSHIRKQKSILLKMALLMQSNLEK